MASKERELSVSVKRFAVKRQHERFDKEVDKVPRKRLALVVESDGRNNDGRCENGAGVVLQASPQGDSSDDSSDKVARMNQTRSYSPNRLPVAVHQVVAV